MTLTAGFYAAAGLPGIEPLWSYPLLAERVLPPVAKGIFLVGLLSVIMSTLDSMSFLSAITLGRDFIWRLRGATGGDDQVRTFTRLGLILSIILAILIALYFESVIDIWYVLGSLAVPVLLLPLLASLFPKLRLPDRSTLRMMLATAALAGVWVLIGYYRGTGEPAYPLAIEPMHPALLLSVCWWLAAWVRRRHEPQNREGIG
jgi:SSS family solute:Na+ symporter